MTQNSEKHYTYDYSFIIKDINQDLSNKWTHRSRSERILNTVSTLPLRGVRAHQLLGTSICSPTREFHWVLVSRAFIRVLLHSYDWLIQWPCDWIQSPAPFPSWEDELAQSPNPLTIDTCLSFCWAAPILSLLVSINSGVIQRACE